MNDEQLARATLEETSALLAALVEREDFKVSELTDLVLRKGVLSRASDIHIEPHRRGVRVRYRIDGVFQDVGYLPARLHDQIVSRIKVLSDLLSHRREIVQEGRISIGLGAQQTDLRVSVVPTVGGEKVVARVFSVARAILDLGEIGYSESMLHRLRAIMFDLEGLFLMTGPSGSGKTTTLYALLHEINRELDAYCSIITIEDPVEFEFGLWSQLQVNRNVGLDFAAGLKAVLRQDPEVIMVGEIRDLETAEVALHAGLTGHLVLSTLHSGSAPETVTRLINMDLEPFVVASALTGTIAQRLVRRLCSECAEPVEHPPAKLELIRRLYQGDDELRFFGGKGCEACDFTGYRGRLPVAEFLDVDEDLRALILEKARTSEILHALLERGWYTILDDGLDKARQGLTTFEEVLRSISLREVLA
ncbi:MAG: type II/IV secretion system protein [Planctomycetota bacterium]|nr:MAG: type II/IV secretion system protein [Planctomycetota bacterium]